MGGLWQRRSRSWQRRSRLRQRWSRSRQRRSRVRIRRRRLRIRCGRPSGRLERRGCDPLRRGLRRIGRSASGPLRVRRRGLLRRRWGMPVSLVRNRPILRRLVCALLRRRLRRPRRCRSALLGLRMLRLRTLPLRMLPLRVLRMRPVPAVAARWRMMRVHRLVPAVMRADFPLQGDERAHPSAPSRMVA